MLQDLGFDIGPEIPARSSARLVSSLRWLSWFTASVSLAIVPWFLGGAIPQARLVLQLGAILSSILAVAVRLISRDLKLRLPLTAAPLLGSCLLAIVQLMPIYSYPALQMKHAAAYQEIVKDPAFSSTDFRHGFSSHTVLPAETRQALVQSLSLTLLVFVLVDVVKSGRDVRRVLGILTLSGTAMTALAMSQQFGVVNVVVGNHWKVSPTVPFGCFVNPNNAAGWMIVCLAAAMYLCACQFQSARRYSMQAASQWTSLGDRIWHAWSGAVGRVAEMTAAQILTVSAVILLVAGIASTLSRAGITATVLGLIAFSMSRVTKGRWLAVFCSLIVIVLVSVLFLSLMDLDTIVLSELQTLKDPVSDSTGRLLHWSDSLRSCLDFPLIGSGVSGYRCASMPYQRHYAGRWFQRADNQYVEVLVESGLIGFICFAGFGILGMVLAIRTLLSRTRRLGPETLFDGWLASSVVLALTALSGAAFFDYGVSLPSVAAAMVAMLALLENRLQDSGRLSHDAKHSRRPDFKFGGGAGFLLWLSLLGSAVALVPDTTSAAKSYSAVAAADRLLGESAFAALEESGDRLLQELNKALEKRPDDFLVARTRFLLLEQLCRRELLLLTTKGQILDQQTLQTRFQSMRPGFFAFHMQNPAVSEDVANQARAEFSSCLRKYSWGEAGKALMKRSVGLPSVGLMMMEFGVIFSDLPCQEAAIQYAQFCEPQDTPGLFEIGQLMLRDGRTDDARIVWELSLKASEQFRSRMISELVRTATIEQSLSWLMPEQYESCVQCAIEMRSEPALRGKLLDRAEQIWKVSAPRITDSVAISRSRHLEEIGSVEAGLQVLKLYLYENPHNLSVRKALASMLEKFGRNGEAYDEWLRIQSFYPDDSSVPVALERLIKLPPTSGN